MLLDLLLLATTASSLALPPPDVEVNFQSLLSSPSPDPNPQTHPSEQHYQSTFYHNSSPNDDDDDDTPLPVIVWHGLGDASNAEGLQSIATLLTQIHPGTYVHLITPTSSPSDRSASFFGNLTTQIDTVCAALQSDPILSTAPAVDALGFSQGGQFLRAYAQRCNNPPIRSLLTFGSQHNGISAFESCKSATDFVCHAANAILKSSTVWSNYVQSHLIPAQYYRDPTDLDNYLAHSNFLADINNERPLKNKTYKTNLSRLQHFVMATFSDDKTVIPRESGWFAEVNETSGHVTQLRDRQIYKEDWIGLKSLDERGALVFEELDGAHMELRDKDLKRLFGRYFGPLRLEKGDGDEMRGEL